MHLRLTGSLIFLMYECIYHYLFPVTPGEWLNPVALPTFLK